MTETFNNIDMTTRFQYLLGNLRLPLSPTTYPVSTLKGKAALKAFTAAM